MGDEKMDYIIERKNGKSDCLKYLNVDIYKMGKYKSKNLKLKIPKIKKRNNLKGSKSVMKMKSKKYKKQKTAGSAKLKMKSLS